MPFITQCSCGCSKFVIISEIVYEGEVDGDGTLACQPQSEYVTGIKCSECERAYRIEDFKDIQY